MAGIVGVATRDDRGVVENIVVQVAQLDIDAQQFGRNFRAFAQNDCTLHGVLQLAHVTWPAVVTDRLLGLCRETQVVTANARTLASQEGVGDFVDVTAALTQGRQFQGNDMQAVIKVFTELPGLGQVLQVPVRCSDQPHINFLRLNRTHPANLAFLQHTQQACLGLQRQFADLVEEQGAAVGCFHQPRTPRAGTGEGAFFVAEQFGFDQGLGNGRAVDRNHRCLGAARQIVQGASDQLLAGARLALDKYVGIGGRDLADLAEHVLHRRAGPDDADFTIGRCHAAFVGQRCLAIGARFGGDWGHDRCVLPVTQNARDGLEHLVVVERFGDVVHRAHFHRIYCRAQAGIAGHDQHRCALAELDQLGTGCTGQAQVADDQVEGGNAEAFLCFLYRAGFADLVLVPLQQTTQGRADDGFVFDDQNVRH